MLAIERCTKEDFDRPQSGYADVSDHDQFWDNDVTLPLHHPIFIFEFGDTAFVMRDGDTIAAYLLGFFSQTGPLAYVHMIAVRQDYRRRKLAHELFEHFVSLARRRGCEQVKATASPVNEASIRFHTAMGMRMVGTSNDAGTLVVKDYLRPGTDRVVFLMDLAEIP